jgi:predicted amidophosphoribosyltransferase
LQFFTAKHLEDIAQWSDDAIELLKEQEAVKAEIEGGGSSWWYVCSECHGAIDKNDQYCRHCGRKVMTE